MANISSIGSGVYTSMAYLTAGTTSLTAAAADINTAFVSTDITNVTDVREFPTFGTPANIVNVPVYGQSISSQVTAQADAPTLEITLNYVPETHKTLEALRTSGVNHTWRIALQNDQVNTDQTFFYFNASVASFTVTPSLSDSNQATMTLALQSDFVGPIANDA